MNLIELNNKIEAFVQKHDLSIDALALKKEHAISSSENLQKELSKLDDDERVLRVGIIGRVKAGKSSMLNALLFNGNDILPKAATPMTAALTIMQYSENVHAEVDFFTQKDIDEIKNNYDVYQKELQRLEQEKYQEQQDRMLNRKQKGLLAGKPTLDANEQQECREKARTQAEREMKNHASYASYDQYSRIQASGKTLADLEQYRTIQANSIEELMNGELNNFVGSSGQFMPFTKSVTLYIPEKGLEGLQIIDTPGINDPVTSRGERTEELLQHCDVVLVVSPSGQFLSDEDTNLLHRITTKEGTQQAYIIASQVDNQLFGSERQGLSNPIDVLARISDNLTQHARNVLRKQVAQEPSMRVAADKLGQNNVICSSSVAYSLHQRFEQQDTWDSNQQHVWRNLNQFYPDTFQHPDMAKNALTQMANIDKLHGIVQEVTANKEQILAERRANFEKDKQKALQGYLQAWRDRINQQVEQIKNADVGALREQEAQIKNNQSTIEMNVGNVYEDLVTDINLNLSKQLKDKLSSIVKQYDSAAESAQGTVTESEEVCVGRKWGFLWKKYETRHYEVNTAQATTVRRAIEEIRERIEDELSYLSVTYSQSWKKAIYNKIVMALRESMEDSELDTHMIARAIKNVLALIPDSSFQIAEGLPSNLRKSGQLKGRAADKFMSAAEEYVSSLRSNMRSEIDSYMRTLVSNLKSINLAKELTGQLEENLSQLLNEIENKEASLFKYENMAKELDALRGEAVNG